MYARAVDEAAARLRDLRQDEWSDLVLAVIALALSLVMTAIRPELAVPLFVGGLALGTLGVRAALEQWEIVDRLAGERDAYVISEIRRRAAREATMDRRHTLSTHVRWWLREPVSDRVRVAAAELDALAAELDDETLELEPACAVALSRLLSDAETSPLLNATLLPTELRSRISQIRSGFSSRARAPDAVPVQDRSSEP